MQLNESEIINLPCLRGKKIGLQFPMLLTDNLLNANIIISISDSSCPVSNKALQCFATFYCNCLHNYPHYKRNTIIFIKFLLRNPIYVMQWEKIVVKQNITVPCFVFLHRLIFFKL